MGLRMVSIDFVNHKERTAHDTDAHLHTKEDESHGDDTSEDANQKLADLQFTSPQAAPNHDNQSSVTDSSVDDDAGIIDNAVSLGGDPSSNTEPNVTTINRHKEEVFALAVSEDLLYTASESKDIRVFRAPSFEQVDCFGSGNGMVQSLMTFGDQLYSAHQDNKVRVWRRVITTSAEISRCMKHKLLAVLPKLNNFVKSMLLDRHYLQVRRHKKLLWIEHADTISALALGSSRSGRGGDNIEQGPPPTVLYSASWDKTVKVWCLRKLKCIESFYAHKDAINALLVINGIVLATASADGSIKLWTRLIHSSSRRKKHTLINTLEGHKTGVNALAISENAKTLYSGGCDGVIIAWKKVQSKPHTRLSRQISPVGRTVSERGLLQNARCSITSSDNTSNHDFDAAGDQCSCVIKTNHAQVGPTSSGEIISESIDGRVAKQSHKCGLGKLARPNRSSGGLRNISFVMRKIIIGHTRAVLSVSAVRDDTVCSSSADKTIRVWRRITGDLLHHSYSLKQQQLLELDSGSAKGAGGRSPPWEYECLAVLEGHGGPVKSIASVLCPKDNLISAWLQKYDANNTGMVIFSASLDAKVKVWVMFED